MNNIPCNIEVNELTITEHIECSAKLSGLSAATRGHIIKHYGSSSEDMAHAEQIAARVVSTYAVPPTWAYEIAGPRKGWYEMHRFAR